MNGNTVNDILAGLKKLGYEIDSFKLKAISGGRIEVTVGNEVIGIWDEARRTFVD